MNLLEYIPVDCIIYNQLVTAVTLNKISHFLCQSSAPVIKADLARGFNRVFQLQKVSLPNESQHQTSQSWHMHLQVWKVSGRMPKYSFMFRTSPPSSTNSGMLKTQRFGEDLSLIFILQRGPITYISQGVYIISY